MGALLISLVALILSGLSLYETNLKQARLMLHVGAAMYEVRDAEGVEVFALPVTITNHGARDAVVTALDLGTRSTPATSSITPWPGGPAGDRERRLYRPGHRLMERR